MNNETQIFPFACETCKKQFRVNKNDVTPVDNPTGKEQIGIMGVKKDGSEELAFVDSEKFNNKNDETLAMVNCSTCEGEMFAFIS